MLKMKNLFDFVTITPFLITLIPDNDTDVMKFFGKFIGIVRIVRVFRVFRIYKLSKESNDESFSMREHWEV